jgi:hypothetical protein
MKKILIFTLALSLMVPALAFAATEFSLGGYIKLDTFWDSTQNDSLLLHPVPRGNTAADSHGRFNMRAQESRFNFTIKGPEVFGAKLTGFIEMDFDGTTDAVVSASGTWAARLRHAMFRLNWPGGTELLMGQYWGVLSNWWVESAEDGPFIPFGSALDRIPQIRLSQKFAGDWTVSGLVGLPYGATLDNAEPYSANANNASAAETPQLQAMVRYEHDFWGKAAYYGHPIPFTATLSGGWERAINRLDNAQLIGGLGETNYVGVVGNVKQKVVSPWIVQGALFIPVIPTHSANLAGTASILTQGFIGQGVEAFGIFGGASNLYQFQGLNSLGQNVFDAKLLSRYGAFAQGQYYFTNQWFLNATYGFTKNYQVSRDDEGFLGTNATGAIADQFRFMEQVDATLWYRPITALKFGLQYTYAHSDYYQKILVGNPVNNNITNKGDEHRVEFVGIYYF